MRKHVRIRMSGLLACAFIHLPSLRLCSFSFYKILAHLWGLAQWESPLSATNSIPKDVFVGRAGAVGARVVFFWLSFRVFPQSVHISLDLCADTPPCPSRQIRCHPSWKVFYIITLSSSKSLLVHLVFQVPREVSCGPHSPSTYHTAL